MTIRNAQRIGADMAPATDTPIHPRSRFRRRLWASIVVGMTLLTLAAVVVPYQLQLQAKRRNSVIADVRSARGTVSTPPTILELGEKFLRQDFRIDRDNGVRLMDPALRDGWLRKHGNLAELQITELDLRATREFDAEDAGVFADNPIAIVHVPLARNVDRVAAALTNCETFTSFDARGSDLSDDGLRLLPLEQLQRLELQNSTVTVEGLQALPRCRQLEFLAIDGKQLDAEVVTALKSLTSVKTLRLVGRDVADEHMKLISELSLERLELERTSETQDGIEQVRSRQPGIEVVSF